MPAKPTLPEFVLQCVAGNTVDLTMVSLNPENGPSDPPAGPVPALVFLFMEAANGQPDWPYTPNEVLNWLKANTPALYKELQGWGVDKYIN